uniref:Uncharacterized protein n=1 Tax=Salix viminalis TaxID=40686 RepID=A0A6N2MTB8_SALVM
MDTEESTSVMDNHETLISTTDVELLKRAWLNEKSARRFFSLRCTNDLGKHFDDTVLAKSPDNYQSILKQCITSEEDAMESVSKSLKLFVVLGLCNWIVGMIFVISESVTERHASINLRTDDK